MTSEGGRCDPSIQSRSSRKVKVIFSYTEFKANQHETSSKIKSDKEPKGQQEEEGEKGRRGQEEEDASARGRT